MTSEELIKDEKSLLGPSKIGICVMQIAHMCFMTLDTLNGTYRNKKVELFYWIHWIVINTLCFIAWKF